MAISTEYITLSEDNKAASAILRVHTFEEDGLHYIEASSLDLITHGDTAEDAIEAFKDLLKEYFRYTVERDTLASDLARCGWTRHNNKIVAPAEPRNAVSTQSPGDNMTFRAHLLTPFKGQTPIWDGLFKNHLRDTSLTLCYLAPAMCLRVASSRLVLFEFGSFQR